MIPNTTQHPRPKIEAIIKSEFSKLDLQFQGVISSGGDNDYHKLVFIPKEGSIDFMVEVGAPLTNGDIEYPELCYDFSIRLVVMGTRRSILRSFINDKHLSTGLYDIFPQEGFSERDYGLGYSTRRIPYRSVTEGIRNFATLLADFQTYAKEKVIEIEKRRGDLEYARQKTQELAEIVAKSGYNVKFEGGALRFEDGCEIWVNFDSAGEIFTINATYQKSFNPWEPKLQGLAKRLNIDDASMKVEGGEIMVSGKLSKKVQEPQLIDGIKSVREAYETIMKLPQIS